MGVLCFRLTPLGHSQTNAAPTTTPVTMTRRVGVHSHRVEPINDWRTLL